MAGPIIYPDSIDSNANKIYSTQFTFSGGGTQTVLTPARGETWLLCSSLQNYGTADDRHGQYILAARTIYGTDVTKLSLIVELDTTGTFAVSGSNITYTAGGGDPYTAIWMMRLV